MPIVGGSGIFRFARGYALAKTVWFNKNGDAIVEYNVTVSLLYDGTLYSHSGDLVIVVSGLELRNSSHVGSLKPNTTLIGEGTFLHRMLSLKTAKNQKQLKFVLKDEKQKQKIRMLKEKRS
ncbi:hypothetical protein Gotur_012196 [Gossypium turneri]